MSFKVFGAKIYQLNMKEIVMTPSEKDPVGTDSGKPPLFSSWTGWYYLVLGSLLLYIIFFDLFTRAFN